MHLFLLCVFYAWVLLVGLYGRYFYIVKEGRKKERTLGEGMAGGSIEHTSVGPEASDRECAHHQLVDAQVSTIWKHKSAL